MNSAGRAVPTDGAPMDPMAPSGTGTGVRERHDAADLPPGEGTLVGRVAKAVSRVRSAEGLRGYSARTMIFARKAGSLVLLAVCVAVSDRALSSTPAWRFGAQLMLFSAVFMLVVGAIGSILYPEARYTVIERTREFAFAWSVLPATALAVAMYFVKAYTDGLGGDTSDSSFLAFLYGSAFPLMYFAIVLVPAIVFAQYVFRGLRATNRKALLDEESMAGYMRQDPMQR